MVINLANVFLQNPATKLTQWSIIFLGQRLKPLLQLFADSDTDEFHNLLVRFSLTANVNSVNQINTIGWMCQTEIQKAKIVSTHLETPFTPPSGARADKATKNKAHSRLLIIGLLWLQEHARPLSGMKAPLGNAGRQIRSKRGDVVSSAFPSGKQHGYFSSLLDVTRSEFQKIAQEDRKEKLLLLLRTFSHAVYATMG